jgi:hypothetical protein
VDRDTSLPAASAGDLVYIWIRIYGERVSYISLLESLPTGTAVASGVDRETSCLCVRERETDRVSE